jgi:ElaB/YqjD/DUF883 family membrane-anchored ribosome-binding protein
VLRTSNHSGDFSTIERRLLALEQRLDRLGTVAAKASANGTTGLMQAADRVADAVASAFGDAADRLRGGARSVGDEAARVGQEAARLGGDAVQRISREVSQRPLVVLGIAIGLGVLVGLAGRRR